MAAAGREDPDRLMFGMQVKRIREQRGWSREELGDQMGFSPSTVSNIENGYRSATPDQAKALDAAFGLPAFFELEEARFHRLPFSAGLVPFVPAEAKANVLKIYEPLVVPGLLQTDEYMRAILSRHADATPELVNERAAGRLDRQLVLKREHPPRMWVLIDKGVLHREIGSKKVMVAQLSRLLEAAESPDVVLQVMTDTAHCGLSGAFAIAELPAGKRIGYLENAIDGAATEDPGVIAELEWIFGVLMAESLRSRDSIALLEEALKQWME